MQIEAKKKAALNLAIEACGSAAKLAERLSIKRQAVYQWEQVPLDRVVDVERITGVPRELLRPDIFTKTEGAAA